MNKLSPQMPEWIKRELPDFLISDYFQTSLGKIHYLHGGLGKKTVLLLHGNPTWSFIWRKVISELGSENFSIVAPDLLNLGFSDELNKKNFSIEKHSQALSELVEGLNLQNVILVVQDWGGPIGLLMASKMAERFSNLVILNTGASKPTPPYRVSKFHEFVHRKYLPEIAFRVFGFPMFTLHKVQFNKKSISGNVAKAYRYPIRQNNRWTSALQFARMVPNGPGHPAFQFFDSIEEYCKNFQGSVEIVWGLKDPILGRGLKKMKSMFPQARVAEVTAGHFLQEECPAEISDAIKRSSGAAI